MFKRYYESLDDLSAPEISDQVNELVDNGSVTFHTTGRDSTYLQYRGTAPPSEITDALDELDITYTEVNHYDTPF